MDEAGRPFVGHADVFVSHSWDTPWVEVMAAVEAHQAQQQQQQQQVGRDESRDGTELLGLPPPLLTVFYYWVDIFAVCQHWKTTSSCAGQTGHMPIACGRGCIGCAKVTNDMPSWVDAPREGQAPAAAGGEGGEGQAEAAAGGGGGGRRLPAGALPATQLPRLKRTPSNSAMGFDRVIATMRARKTLLVMEPWDNPRVPTRVSRVRRRFPPRSPSPSPV